jgi:DNA-binding response OmpR family regulator
MDAAGKTILIIEDERDVVDLLALHLRKSGKFAVSTANDGASGLDKARNERPAFIILDLMLPKMPGLEVCKVLKTDPATRHIPIMMLTAKAEEIDRIVGLEFGADDYVTKPFSPKELLARVRRAMRRGSPATSGTTSRTTETVEHQLLMFSNIKIDFTSMEATRAGKRLSLTAQEFKLLRFLASAPDVVISREKLLNDVWGYENYPTTRTVDNHILRLRQKLEPDPANPRYFLTMHGAGYKFTPGANPAAEKS